MARNAPKAAMAMVGGLYDPTELGIKDKMLAAKELTRPYRISKNRKSTSRSKGWCYVNAA